VPSGLTVAEASELRSRDPATYLERARASIADHVRGMLEYVRAGSYVFDYGNNLRGEAQQAGVEEAFSYPGFVPAYIRSLFCRGIGPFRWAVLSGDPGDIAAIDEMLRIDDPFLVNRRVTTAETPIAGVVLEPETRVYLNWTSANRDEAVFGDPDAYRPEEHARHNLVYGTGIHACPGRPLATMELAAVTRTLLESTTHLDLAADAESERETYPLGGWRRVPVRLR